MIFVINRDKLYPKEAIKTFRSGFSGEKFPAFNEDNLLTLSQKIRTKYAKIRGDESNDPSVSIIIPVLYDSESSKDLFELILQLVSNNVTRTVEILLVINGMTTQQDLEDSELSRLLKELPIKLIYLSQKDDKRELKIRKARQAGLNESKGEFVISLDADCDIGPNYISGLVASLQDSTFAYGPVWYETSKWERSEKLAKVTTLFAKSIKAFIGEPSYQGGNHAFRRNDLKDMKLGEKSILDNFYLLVDGLEQEIPIKIRDLVKRGEINLSESNHDLSKRVERISFSSRSGIFTPFGYAERAKNPVDMLLSQLRSGGKRLKKSLVKSFFDK